MRATWSGSTWYSAPYAGSGERAGSQELSGQQPERMCDVHPIARMSPAPASSADAGAQVVQQLVGMATIAAA